MSTLYDLISAMANYRRGYSAERGLNWSDEEIADSIKASLVEMMEVTS